MFVFSPGFFWNGCEWRSGDDDLRGGAEPRREEGRLEGQIWRFDGDPRIRRACGCCGRRSGWTRGSAVEISLRFGRQGGAQPSPGIRRRNGFSFFRSARKTVKGNDSEGPLSCGLPNVLRTRAVFDLHPSRLPSSAVLLDHENDGAPPITWFTDGASSMHNAPGGGRAYLRDADFTPKWTLL